MLPTLRKIPRVAWPILACLACLLPFADKPVHVDDPLFLWAGRHIQTHPVDFYGFEVNWYGKTMPMHEVMENPPLASYYIALATALFGWSESSLHLAFLIWAMGAIWGTYRLAERFSCRPLLATLIALFTPVFLVSSANLMCDTMMLCFWVWALVLWDRGLVHRRWGPLLWAALLITLCALTKYFGIALIPLLLVYSLHRSYVGPRISTEQPNRSKELAVAIGALLIPVLVLAGYQWLTFSLYSRGLLMDAAAYALQWRVKGQNLSMFLAGVAFSGGCLIGPFLFVPFLASARNILLRLVCAGLLVAGLWYFGALKALLPVSSRSEGLASLQMCLFLVGGLLVLWLVCENVLQLRDSDSLLLGMWAGGTFVFATLVNWTVNGRSFLPMVPAVGIMIARSLQQRQALPGLLRPGWMLLPAAVLSLVVTWADYRWAESLRKAADLIRTDRNVDQWPRQVWFQGHWGFQYYMEQSEKFAAADLKRSRVKAGDLMIIPVNNTNVIVPPFEVFKRVGEIKITACPWLALMKTSAGAGFYSVSIAGKLPYAFGPIEPDVYWLILFVPESRSPPKK
jgi:4-amino-4-deoxy-L-arabinose transferase-like glycosyltransferase